MANEPVTDTQDLHSRSIIIDTHCDTLGRVYEGQRRLGERSTLGQFDLARALQGGLTAEFMATFVDYRRPGSPIRQTLHFIDVYYQELEAYADMALMATSADDIVRAKQEGKVALMLSMEGAEGLGGDLRVLRTCYHLGLRSLGITWDRRNEAGDGTGESRTGGGLSEFGVQLVSACNELGILIDLAHLNPEGMDDVLAVSTAPVIVTHANCHALWPHPRNLSDEKLEAVAKNGGVVGLTPIPPFMGEDKERSHLEVLLEHADHMIKIMGDDHVGLGMDFDGIGEKRTTLIEDVSELPNVTQGLVERGYSTSTIRKLLGENVLRVLRAVL